MGCGCNKAKKDFIVTHADGRTETFATRAAASSAVRRSGGKATMKEVAKA